VVLPRGPAAGLFVMNRCGRLLVASVLPRLPADLYNMCCFLKLASCRVSLI
jgi:hypothetical protein